MRHELQLRWFSRMNEGIRRHTGLRLLVLDGGGSAAARWGELPLRRHLRRATPELVLGFASALLYAVISVVRHLRFQSGVDLAIFDQAVAGYAAGTMPYSDIKAVQPFNLLGDHFSPIIAVLAPIYRIWPHAELLLLAQAALFGLSVGLVTRIARRSHGALASALIGAAFMLSRGLMDAVTFDFHEVAFAVPLIIWAIDSLSRQRIGQAAIASGLLMLVKEDSAFLLVGIGLWLLFERRWRLGVAWTLGGVASFGVVILMIIPIFSFYGRYTYLDSGSIHAEGLIDALTAFTVNAMNGLASWTFIVMVIALVAPTLGRAFLSPILLVAVPGIAARLALPQDAYISLGAHYNATFSAIAFLAALDAGSRASGPLWPRAARSSAPGRRSLAWPGMCVALAVATLFLRPAGPLVSREAWSCDACDAAAAAIAVVPDGAEVAADPYLTSHLTGRARVRLLIPSFTDSASVCLAPEYVLADRRSAAIEGLIQRLTDSGAYTMVLQAAPYAVLRAVGPAELRSAGCSK
jgi:uncharacterized membrane protein